MVEAVLINSVLFALCIYGFDKVRAVYNICLAGEEIVEEGLMQGYV